MNLADEHNIIFNITPLALGQSRDFPSCDFPSSDGEVTLKHRSEIGFLIKHDKSLTVCLFHRIYSVTCSNRNASDVQVTYTKLMVSKLHTSNKVDLNVEIFDIIHLIIYGIMTWNAINTFFGIKKNDKLELNKVPKWYKSRFDMPGIVSYHNLNETVWTTYFNKVQWQW